MSEGGREGERKRESHLSGNTLQSNSTNSPFCYNLELHGTQVLAALKEGEPTEEREARLRRETLRQRQLDLQQLMGQIEANNRRIFADKDWSELVKVRSHSASSVCSK